MQCAYCDRPAHTRIPAIPENVCDAHAAEFWTGLVAFAKTQSVVFEPEAVPCRCRTCNELSASKALVPFVVGAEIVVAA